MTNNNIILKLFLVDSKVEGCADLPFRMEDQDEEDEEELLQQAFALSLEDPGESKEEEEVSKDENCEDYEEDL